MLTVLRQRFSGFVGSVIRYPVTVVFLIAAAVLTAISIANDAADHLDLLKITLTCAVGAVACAAGQAAFERFLTGSLYRILTAAAGIAVTLLFYFMIRALPRNNAELFIRFAVMTFALFIAYVWVGVIRSRYGFSESFMAAFKALFQSVFFSGVLFLGCVAIIAAVDRLITPVNSDAYSHTANVIFIIITPLMLLSLIPVYPGRANLEQGVEMDGKRGELLDKRTGCPKFLEVLLSYIVIPLASVFTVILLVYILLNIGGAFWTNNLLEPMLIAYTITVIVVTILVGNLENRLAVLFRAIFPKVLIPIALFQVVASVLILRGTGVTSGRYYVIVYGVFAVFSGVILSLMRVRKSGVIALVLIVLSAISLTPPVDAFTVSRSSQIYTLESTLKKNGMLQNGAVTPNGSISEADKNKIITSIQYLSETENLGEVRWLPARFNGYDDTVFFSTFGFHLYTPATPEYRYVSVYFNLNSMIPITGYDIFTQVSIPSPDKSGDKNLNTIDIKGKTYSLTVEAGSGSYYLVIKDKAGPELFRYDTKEIFQRYAAYPSDKSILTQDEAAFGAENDKLALKIIVLNVGFSTAPDSRDHSAQLLVFVKLK